MIKGNAQNENESMTIDTLSLSKKKIENNTISDKQ